MPATDPGDDVAAIRALIAKQFACLDWAPGKPADWAGFASVFFPGAPLVPSGRPARYQTVAAFIERMQGLSEQKLQRFEETMLGCEILVFGNVAVALGACEMLENGTETTRDVSGFLFIKDEGAWQIAAQAWDLESGGKPIPSHLREPASAGNGR